VLKQVARGRARRAKAYGPGAPAVAFLAGVAVVACGVGAIVSWLVWSHLGVGVGIVGGLAIVASGGLFAWSESQSGPEPNDPKHAGRRT
jgi:hypothetical protein